MHLSPRRLNRATLARQLLLDRAALPVAEAVRHVVALQAQAPPSPYLALWNRVASFDPADLDAAFIAGDVVKSTSLRIALHATHRDDYTVFHQAMLANLRASRLNDRRFAEADLPAADVDALLPGLIAWAADPRTVDEIEGWLTERLGAAPHPRVWWALRTFAPLVHVPTGGPWSFTNERRFRAAPDRPPRVDAVEAMQRLLLRYLEGFGPASARDFGQFALQRKPAVDAAVEGLGDRLTIFGGPGGETLLDVADAPLPAEDAAAPPRLLGMWDGVLLAYVDRSRVLPDDLRTAVIRRNGDVLPTVLVDGFVVGVWRPVADAIEITAYRDVSEHAWSELEGEAAGLVALLADRDPATYARYGHWWSKLPSGEVRVLGG